MKNILIFGARGMLGHVLANQLKATTQYHLIGALDQGKNIASHYPVDVRDQVQVKRYVCEVQPDIVINCAGILVQESQKNIEDAILVNSLFPNLLSRLGEEYNFKLIHISTDCVFSGKEGNYTETSPPNGDSVYARTKILGEVANKKNLIVRTSIIGPELRAQGSGLLKWFVKQKGEIKGFKNAIWTGVTTLELAKGLIAIIAQDLTGIIHFIPNAKISKYELLLLLKEIWGKDDIQILADEGYRTDKSLTNNRNDLNFSVKSYEEMLFELKEYIQVNRLFYPDYS
jgi:dTDP-4-dehydrorhamnose reductase